jgi:hypothetical protein
MAYLNQFPIAHHRDAESTEKRVFAHSREIRRRPFDKPFDFTQGHEQRRMAQRYGGTSTANGQVALLSSGEVDPCRRIAPSPHKGVHSSDLLAKKLLPQADSGLSFAGIFSPSRKLNELEARK